MTWEPDYPYYYYVHAQSDEGSGGPLRANEQCFIRKEHKCGKIYGASKSCFIACPTDDQLETILELIAEKLMKLGIEPIIAVKERAYGQDIFCTKICGKIIESRFCLVILDDTVENGHGIPNPNVYYEYGVMTALRKHIVPLQKDDLDLAFNIQSHDTIKYSHKNVASELDRALKDAIRVTEGKETDAGRRGLSDRTLLRRLELSDFDAKDTNWFLHDAISDTAFKGFGQHTHRFYAYIGKISNAKDFETYLDDAGVALYRTEKKHEEIAGRLKSLKMTQLRLQAESERQQEANSKGPRIRSYEQMSLEKELHDVNAQIPDMESKLDLMEKMYIGFVMAAKLDTTHFVSRMRRVLEPYKRYHLTVSNENAISFGEVRVLLEVPALAVRDEGGDR